MITRNSAQIDEAWIRVAQATFDDLLGPCAKVATASQAAHHNGSHLICAYVQDSTDKEDVFRVRKELKILGFTEKLRYKPGKANKRLKARYPTQKQEFMKMKHSMKIEVHTLRKPSHNIMHPVSKDII